MKRQLVGIKGKEYEILSDDGLLAQFGILIQPYVKQGEQIAVVTDENVWRLYSEPFSVALKNAGLNAKAVVLPPGESTKSMHHLKELYQQFAAMKLKRTGLVVAFGGGVIGDLAGFAASTYMRGIPFIQIPTTLLAQVDSSVGGKTAINLDVGKNNVGAFYQPKIVLIDTSLLLTLPSREFSSGMAEVVKYGAIASPALFEQLENGSHQRELAAIIMTCCGLKSQVVAKDELDTGERMILNFGHTFGHAIEKLGGYTDYYHGEAVGMGMVIAAKLGEKLDVTAKGCAKRLADLLAYCGLDTQCPYPLMQLLPEIQQDKKSEANQVTVVLIKDIGHTELKQLSYQQLSSVMERI